MRLPIHISLNKTVEELEANMREAIRKDTGIAPQFQSVSLMIYTHAASNAVGFMYEAIYRSHAEAFDAALDTMGWQWEYNFEAPTCHAQKLRSVT